MTDIDKMRKVLHDLANCLTVIQSELPFLCSQQCPAGLEEKHVSAKCITQMTERACRILAEARKTQGIDQLEKTDAASLVSSHRQLVEHANIPVEMLEVVKSEKPILYSTVGVERVVLNIVSNALKAGATKILLTAKPENGWYAVSLLDNGKGMTKQRLRRIGLEYINGQGEEHGQGGKIIREQCSDMHAAVEWYSLEGLGTKVTIYYSLEDYHV